MRRVRVLDLRDTYEIGGPGKTILETFRAIDTDRFDLHLATFVAQNDSGDSPFVAAARDCGLPVHFVRGRHHLDPRFVWRLADLVGQLEIDILHAHDIQTDVLGWLSARVRRVPIVTTLHGWFGHSRKHRSYIWLDKQVARGYDMVIAVSARIKEEARAAGVPEARLRLLHNAIVLDRYRRSGARGLISRLAGRDIPRPIVISVGRLSPEKGHADLIRAVGLVARQGFRLSLALAGDGPSRPQLEEQIRQEGLEGQVHLLGYVQQPQRVLEDADLAVLPSHTEGLPNAALEAMAMEVPLLATAVGGTPEVVTHQVTGHLVPPQTPDALAEALLDFCRDPARWQQMAARAKPVVEAQFGFDRRTRRLEELYLELVRRA